MAIYKQIDGKVNRIRGKEILLAEILLDLARASDEVEAIASLARKTASYWEIRFILDSVVAGDDVLASRATVFLPRDINNTQVHSYIQLKNFYISAKSVPSGGDFACDIEVTNDFGTTWKPIFPTVNKPTLLDGQKFVKFGQFSVDRLFDRDQLRVDIDDDSGAPSGVELTLTGVYVS